jgi:hypothetical protein
MNLKTDEMVNYIFNPQGGNATYTYINSTGVTGTVLSTSPVYTFSLPILSGIIGANCPKLFSVSALGNPVHAEFTLSQNDDAIYYGTSGAVATWQLVNIEM